MEVKQQLEIQMFLEQACKENVFPGALMSVINNEDTTYFCVGNKAIFPKVESNDLNTIYDLGSLTKVIVTTTLIMQLIEENKLSLETKIADIITEFKHREMTVKQILTHQSGLPAELILTLNDTPKSIEDKLYHCELAYSPNSRVFDSDVGFIILGKVIEKIMNQPLDQVAKERIFDPLEMNETSYGLQDVYRTAPTEDSKKFNELIRGQVHDSKCRLMGGVAGHSGLFSTIQDLTKFAKMLLNKGQYNGHQILSESSITEFYHNYSLVTEINRGLGYLCYDEHSLFSKYNSTKSISYTGFTGTSILIDFDKNIGIVLLSNRIHPSRENVRLLPFRKQLHQYVFELLTTNNK